MQKVLSGSFKALTPPTDHEEEKVLTDLEAFVMPLKVSIGWIPRLSRWSSSSSFIEFANKYNHSKHITNVRIDNKEVNYN